MPPTRSPGSTGAIAGGAADLSRMTVYENLQMGPPSMAAPFRAGPGAGLCDIPAPEGTALPARRHDVGRRAADAGDRPRPDEPAAAAAARRAVARLAPPLIVKQIFSAIKELNERDGMTVFLVEQKAYHALKLAHRGYVMVTGTITMSGTGKQLLDDPSVKAAISKGDGTDAGIPPRGEHDLALHARHRGDGRLDGLDDRAAASRSAGSRTGRRWSRCCCSAFAVRFITTPCSGARSCRRTTTSSTRSCFRSSVRPATVPPAPADDDAVSLALRAQRPALLAGEGLSPTPPVPAPATGAGCGRSGAFIAPANRSGSPRPGFPAERACEPDVTVDPEEY